MFSETCPVCFLEVDVGSLLGWLGGDVSGAGDDDG